MASFTRLTISFLALTLPMAASAQEPAKKNGDDFSLDLPTPFADQTQARRTAREIHLA